MAKPGSSPIALAAVLIRIGSLILGVAACILIRGSTIETSLVARFLGDPEPSHVERTIGAFRFWNHLYVLPGAALGSLVACRLATKLLGGRFERLATASIPGVLFFLFFSIAVQPLPHLYVVHFLLLGFGLTGLAAAAHRIQGGGRVVVWAALSGFYLCLPFLSEVLTPRFAFRRLYGVRSRPSRWAVRALSSIPPRYTVVVLCSLATYTLAVGAICLGKLPDRIKGRNVERIAEGDFHGLAIDSERNRLLADNIALTRIEAYSIEDHPRKLRQWSIPTRELENIRINPARNELYHFDRGSNRLRIYSSLDLSLKRESGVDIRGQGTAQVEFDNDSGTILVTREGDYVWIFDLDTLALRFTSASAGIGNADVLFSKVVRKYVLSYYSRTNLFRTLTPSGRLEEFEALPYQSNMAESVRRAELYVAMPVEGAVYVYDLAGDLRLKRVLPTVFGVRGLAYDSVHDLLLTASMVDGYLNVLEPGSGRILESAFVGYYLRVIRLSEERREAFISSKFGGVYRFRY